MDAAHCTAGHRARCGAGGATANAMTLQGGYMERTSKNVEIVVVVLLLAWGAVALVFAKMIEVLAG